MENKTFGGEHAVVFQKVKYNFAHLKFVCYKPV